MSLCGIPSRSAAELFVCVGVFSGGAANAAYFHSALLSSGQHEKETLFVS